MASGLVLVNDVLVSDDIQRLGRLLENFVRCSLVAGVDSLAELCELALAA